MIDMPDSFRSCGKIHVAWLRPPRLLLAPAVCSLFCFFFLSLLSYSSSVVDNEFAAPPNADERDATTSTPTTEVFVVHLSLAFLLGARIYMPANHPGIRMSLTWSTFN